MRRREFEIAAEFVRRKVGLIVTGGGAVLALKRATSVIPIVFAVANDPLGRGHPLRGGAPEKCPEYLHL